MVENRPVMKKCPKCRQSAALASKLCGNQDCGYSFNDAKQMQTRNAKEEPRRTNRARRENPKYSDAGDLEAEKNKRQKLHHNNDSQNIPPQRTSDFGSEDAKAESNKNQNAQQEPQKSDSQEVPPRRTSGRTKESKEIQMENRRKRLQEIKDRREDLCGQLSQGKQELVTFFLSEINRKFASVAWKP